MKSQPTTFAAAALTALASLLPSPALAWGPAMHVREAERTLEVLKETDDSWAILVDSDPLALSYLRLGAISPDFQHGSATLNFGHSKALSYHLLESAPDDRPDLKLFALGHLVHLAGDATAEAFVSPWVWAAHPLGMYDLFVGGDGVVGEAETIMEGFSEITLGSWDPVIDVLYDFYLGGDEARARMDEILAWYCEQGRAHAGGGHDCEQIRVEILDKLATADDLLGSLPREEAKAYFANLLNKPPDELVWLFTGGLLQSLIGSSLDGSIHQPWEVDRFLNDVFADEDWWAFYDESFQDMAASFTRDHLQVENTGWPGWNAGALAGGNHQSVMLMNPDAYAYGQGLIVDELRWTDERGDEVAEIAPEGASARYAAEVRFFSALPLEGTVRARVRKDAPGLLPTGDAVVGQAEVQVDIDPLAYTLEERTTIRVEFDADPAGALGYYVELTLDEEDRPWFTSSWDQLWGIEEAPLFWHLYRNNFGTYGRFPGSLPFAEPDVETGGLFVAVRYDVADLAIPDALVSVDGDEPVRVGGNGIVSFDTLEPGARNVTVEFAGVDPVHGTVEVTAAGEAWLDLTLSAAPLASAPEWATAGCVPLTWDPILVGRPLATALFARLKGAQEWTELAVVDEPALCGEFEDGSKSEIELLIEFGEGRSPEIATTGEVAFDSTPPDLGQPSVSVACDVVTVDLSISEPHSGIAELRWQLAGGTWAELEPDATSFTLESSLTDERTLLLQAVNGAGVGANAELAVPRAEGCTETETDPEGETEPPPSAEDFLGGDTATTAGGPAGCAIPVAAGAPPRTRGWGLVRR